MSKAGRKSRWRFWYVRLDIDWADDVYRLRYLGVDSLDFSEQLR